MSVGGPSRRAVAGSLGVALLAWPRWAPAQSPGDRGIGGTGAVDPEPGGDRGIGGTGVVGTIRRFGSIVVNDLRIGYGADAIVTIDGRRATAADLRIGQVVTVAALADTDGLATRRIAVASEVVGPIERRGADHLVVLGQTVVAGDAVLLGRWPLGRFVAVSGLRRPDGVIVASLVGLAPRHLARLSGTPAASGDGTVRIGRLVIRGLDPALAGRRVSVEGAIRGGTLLARRIRPEASLLAALGTERVSLEAFVVRRGDVVATGAGLTAEGAVAPSLPDDDVVRAVISGTLDPGGQVVVDHIAALTREGHRASGTRPGGAPPPGHRGSFGGPGPGGPGGTGPSADHGGPSGGPGGGLGGTGGGPPR